MSGTLKSPADAALMRKAGRIVAEVLDALEAAARPGVSTGELDDLAARLTEERAARAAFRGYHGFPASVCISLNEEVVHGIPSRERIIAEGDLLKLDFGAVYRGFYADAARTVAVGRVSPEVARLLSVTREALEAGIRRIQAGGRVGDISHAVQQLRGVPRPDGGDRVHRPRDRAQAPRGAHHPQCRATAGSGPRLRAGMALCVEPMVTAGSGEVDVLDDGWTAVTVDGRWAAHFEHTILVTERGPEVLTRGAGKRRARAAQVSEAGRTPGPGGRRPAGAPPTEAAAHAPDRC